MAGEIDSPLIKERRACSSTFIGAKNIYHMGVDAMLGEGALAKGRRPRQHRRKGFPFSLVLKFLGHLRRAGIFELSISPSSGMPNSYQGKRAFFFSPSEF